MQVYTSSVLKSEDSIWIKIQDRGYVHIH